MEIIFRKAGHEVKKAIARRQQQLQARLDKRNAILNEFLSDIEKVRSYMVRSSSQDYSHRAYQSHVLFSPDDISGEEKQEIQQLCNRIFEIEQELHRLAVVVTHLDDKQVIELTLDDLISYGFDATGGIEGESA
jgi:histidyl-tRNA synthetase